ncbi:sialidase family protein [Streptomyces sp. NPDC005438]|uniref:sialidase family protein n=1 Tax=Streptomyces sp. NPDC005438 TaxID=3156880 RepID=UPI0033BA45BC
MSETTDADPGPGARAEPETRPPTPSSRTGDDSREGEEERPGDHRMTLRISRDGGRTWSGPRYVVSTDPPLEFSPGSFPPCRCPRCTTQRTPDTPPTEPSAG